MRGSARSLTAAKAPAGCWHCLSTGRSEGQRAAWAGCGHALAYAPRAPGRHHAAPPHRCAWVGKGSIEEEGAQGGGSSGGFVWVCFKRRRQNN